MYKVNGTDSNGYAQIELNSDSDTYVVKSVKCKDGYGRDQIAHYTNKDVAIPRKKMVLDMDKLNAARAWADSMR